MGRILYITDGLVEKGCVYDILTELITRGHSCEKTGVGFSKRNLQTHELEHLLSTLEFDLVVIDRDCLPKQRGAADIIRKQYTDKLILFNFVETQDIFPRATIINPLIYSKEDLLRKIEEYLPTPQMSLSCYATTVMGILIFT